MCVCVCEWVCVCVCKGAWIRIFKDYKRDTICFQSKLKAYLLTLMSFQTRVLLFSMKHEGFCFSFMTGQSDL